MLFGVMFLKPMIDPDPACLFDSDDEEDGEEGAPGASKKKTPEERKFIFRRELRSMLYGFGGNKVTADNTTDVLEQIVVDYIRQVCQKCLSVGKPNRVTLEDIHYLIRRDQSKFNRVQELLSMSEELKKARKAFEDAKEL